MGVYMMHRQNQCVNYFVILITFCTLFTPVYADILPGERPENQVWTTNSLLDAVGITTQSTSLNWYVGDAGLDSFPVPFADGDVIRSGSIAYARYKDSIMSNGGQISEVKAFSLDTHAATEGLYNIETEKVLTYTSQNGSHLLGEEFYLLDVVGNWSTGASSLVCVFSKGKNDIIPAFCNKVTASSKLRSITTAQVESIGSVALIGADPAVKSPAVLQYEISVVPDANSASGYADGIVSTTFTVSVMEGRSDGAVKEIDPFASDGRWSLLAGLMPPVLQWESFVTPGLGSSGVRIRLVRDGVMGDTVFVDYNQASIGHSVPSLSGPVLPILIGMGLPAEVTEQLTIDGGDGGRNTPYTVTYKGASYSISPWLGIAGVNMTQPAGYNLEHYNELAARLTAIDTASAAGGISSFVKEFHYQSGIGCEGC